MKIKNSKIIVAALSLSMILSACGNKDNKANDGSNGSNPTESASTANEKKDGDTAKSDQEDFDITVVSREDGSGTRGAFIELVGLEEEKDGEKKDLTTDEAVVQNSTNGVMQTVSQDPSAIGYVSLGSVNDSVQKVKVDGAEATEENIEAGDYTLQRPFNLAFKEDKLDDLAKDFLAFVLSKDAQEIVGKEGYIKVEAKDYEAKKIKGSMILSIIIVTLIGIPLGVTKLPTSLLNPPSGIGPVSFRIDVLSALKPQYFPWLLTFFVPDFFGTMGIILGVANQAGWLDENGDMPGIEKCFKVDSLSTVLGSFFCMPVMTTYLESASGVEDGGRTGLTAITSSILFALMILFTPLALMVPGVATGPVLTIIGFQMLSSMRSVDYSDKTECLPAFIAVAMTILTYNIANGMALSIVSYLIMKLAAGKSKDIPAPMYAVGVCMLFYLYTLI